MRLLCKELPLGFIGGGNEGGRNELPFSPLFFCFLSFLCFLSFFSFRLYFDSLSEESDEEELEELESEPIAVGNLITRSLALYHILYSFRIHTVVMLCTTHFGINAITRGS